MTDKLTHEALRDEKVLRSEIGRALNSPGVWAHRWMDCSPNAPWCMKCRQRQVLGTVTESTTQGCSVPDPFVGDLAIAAELLLRKVPIPDLVGAAAKFFGITVDSSYERLALVYERFIRVSPANRCIVCLMALKGKSDE
jgi:hypothetical protein